MPNSAVGYQTPYAMSAPVQAPQAVTVQSLASSNPPAALIAGIATPPNSVSYAAAAATVRDNGEATKVHVGTFRSGSIDGITDVPGIGINHITRIEGDAIRDGATVVFPNRDPWTYKVAAAGYTINGNGALTNTDWVNESGRLETPIVLVGNTLDVGRAYDGVIDGMIRQHPQIGRTEDVPLPVVGEIDGQRLNDAPARAISASDVSQLLAGAHAGNFARGSVGAGTPSTAFGYKAGIGSSSRILPPSLGGYTVGVLVNANMDVRQHLRIGGVPVGRYLPQNDLPRTNPLAFHDHGRAKDGSIIIVVATDAPLDPLQLKELAKRTAAGLYRSGSNSRLSSGDQVIAFSTSRYATLQRPSGDLSYNQVPEVSDENTVNALFEATADATESSIDNALLSSKTMSSRQAVVYGMPVSLLTRILEQNGRAVQSGDTLVMP